MIRSNAKKPIVDAGAASMLMNESKILKLAITIKSTDLGVSKITLYQITSRKFGLSSPVAPRENALIIKIIMAKIVTIGTTQHNKTTNNVLTVSI